MSERWLTPEIKVSGEIDAEHVFHVVINAMDHAGKRGKFTGGEIGPPQYWVGESGPESFIPSATGMVVEPQPEWESIRVKNLRQARSDLVKKRAEATEHVEMFNREISTIDERIKTELDRR
jgi:hypothetical protein